jgi:hypothetical protein
MCVCVGGGGGWGGGRRAQTQPEAPVGDQSMPAVLDMVPAH